ncbi:hypothetical protein HK105_203449 [Polyrhizophydium stewartii]|uniref:RGS domain-containing protein n=1 Tax=Polyrhizophydium stewartii TaxID=2732419 RepID=A0ABR4NBW6_9FUNG
MATPSFQQTRAEDERRRRIQVEEQRIAEQQRQHPPAPLLPAGASHWDRLPAELHGMIIKVSSPLTKLAVGAVTPEQLEEASREDQQQAWEDAFATNWKGNLGLLPAAALDTESILLINSCTLFARVKALDIGRTFRGLSRCAIAHEWRDMIDLDNNPRQLSQEAAVVGALWLLHELIDERRSVEPSEELASAAARFGHLEVVKFLHECMPDGLWDKEVATRAILNGHLDVAEWLLANRCDGCDPTRLHSVIAYGQPDPFVKVVVDRGWMVVDERAVCEAVSYRSIDMVQFLRASGGDELFTADAMDEAANNSVAMLEWLHREFELVPTTQALKNAAIRDNVDVASWLLETFPDVQWDLSAAYHLSHDCKTNPRCAAIFLEWASQHGIEIGPSTSPAEPKQLTIVDILESRHLRDAFAKLLAREFAVEGLLFLQTVLQYKRQFQQLSIRPSDTQIAASAASVFRYFLDPNAANEVLLPKKIVDKATIVFETQVQHGCGLDLDVAAKLFDEAAAHVARMLAANHLSKFVLSSAYKDAAAAEEADSCGGCDARNARLYIF